VTVTTCGHSSRRARNGHECTHGWRVELRGCRSGLRSSGSSGGLRRGVQGDGRQSGPVQRCCCSRCCLRCTWLALTGLVLGDPGAVAHWADYRHARVHVPPQLHLLSGTRTPPLHAGHWSLGFMIAPMPPASHLVGSPDRRRSLPGAGAVKGLVPQGFPRCFGRAEPRRSRGCAGAAGARSKDLGTPWRVLWRVDTSAPGEGGFSRLDVMRSTRRHRWARRTSTSLEGCDYSQQYQRLCMSSFVCWPRE